MCLEEFIICSTNSPLSPFENSFVSVGNAASEYDTPIMLNGTDCRLKEKLKTEIDPTVKNDAKEIRNSSANSLDETVIVLGREVKTIFLIKK